MKKQLTLARVLPGRDFDRRAQQFLPVIQQELMPEHASKIVAINVETGEYTLGATDLEAAAEFRRRWPDQLCYMVRVDGRPVVKFHGM